MTDFAHEEYLITHIALGFDKLPLGPDDVGAVTVTVFEPGEPVDDVVPWSPLDGNEDETMAWDPTPTWSIRVDGQSVSGQGWWQYLFNTAGLDGGSYKAKVWITSLTGGRSFETLKIRLKTDPLET